MKVIIKNSIKERKYPYVGEHKSKKGYQVLFTKPYTGVQITKYNDDLGKAGGHFGEDNFFIVDVIKEIILVAE